MFSKLVLSIPKQEIEHGAIEQMNNVLKLSCLKKLVILPDVHQGYDLPIGGVALLDDSICPGFVGYDIGCGMCCLQTSFTLAHLGLATEAACKAYLETLLKRIPVGFTTHLSENNFMQSNTQPFMGDVNELRSKVWAKQGVQFGTLGGGNHFLEIGVNSDGFVAFTIHSGSRRPGYDIADYWMRIAKEKGITERGISYFKLNSVEGTEYLHNSKWGVNYALANRKEMLKTATATLGMNSGDMKSCTFINESHNTVDVTEDGVLHRKGATPAEEGQLGIIPANQRDGVFITLGLGNKEYLNSASHGAGRVMSRSKAKKVLDKDQFKEDMEGVVCKTDASVLDESPRAYKDIDVVLKAQADKLVTIIDHYKPVIVLKG